MRSPIRSLSVKLTLAFLLVGVIGAGLVAVLFETRARLQFDEYLSARDQAALVDVLAGYYSTHKTLTGAADAVSADPSLARYSRDLTLLDSDQSVVLGRRPFVVGEQPPGDLLTGAQPIQVGDQTVGYVVFPPQDRDGGPGSRAVEAERNFLAQLTWASAISAGVAVLIALLLGGFLAQTLSRPVRELTAATKALAGGQLGHRVPVRSSDEIGELAESFNQMSSDLEQATRARQQMTADLAHDLRTPLTILRGYTEGLQDGRLDGTPTIYQTMHGEVVHLQHLVDDLRLLSLADAGALPLSRRAVDPVALLERTALAYFVQAEGQHTALKVDALGPLPSISVDTERMTQVLNNLVSNSLRYTSEGTIVLSAASVDSRVEISVRDTGTGIAAEDLPFVFDRFYRADRARQREGDGTSGLGLAIAKAIVEAHGGTIAAESAVGQGTAIRITLPALPNSPVDASRSTSAESTAAELA
jgi:two-component system, OmpR family, sensor histidine kinase BaeS